MQTRLQIDRVGRMAAAVLFAAASARAQGVPPFELEAAATTSQSVVITPSAEQDDGTHAVEVFPANYAGESRSQSSSNVVHGRLWTIPGSVAYVLSPGTANEVASAPLPNDYGTRAFVVFEDPATTGTSYLLAGEHYFDASCATATCGFLDGGLGGNRGALRSEAESSADLQAGTVAARAETGTPDFGRRFYDARPGGGPIYNHALDAVANAQIEDWVYVTGPAATATLAISATVAATVTTPHAPADDDDWTTPVYGDVRAFNPCSDDVLTSDELLRPTGLHQTDVHVSLAISSGYELQNSQWIASISGAQDQLISRSAGLDWVEGEEAGCSDDIATVAVNATGQLAPSISLELAVPTNQWARVTVASSARARCSGPFSCGLSAYAPADVEITSPDGSLVAWQGIAGLPTSSGPPTTTTTLPTNTVDHLVSGSSLVLKDNPAKAKKKTLTLVAQDKTLTVAADIDPRVTGATLRVATDANDAFDDTYVLVAARWKPIGPASHPKGYKYTDPNGAIRSVVLRPKLVTAAGKGAALGHTLGASPDPVVIVLTTGEARYCLRFGGTVTFKASKRYTAKGAAAPAACR
jgi:hypothetical protein